MSAEGSVKEEQDIEVLFETEETESSVELPAAEWSSLQCWIEGSEENEKRRLFAEGLYEPPTEEICALYIPLSDSSIYRHPYYPYKAISDPGIEDALLLSPSRIVYEDDGQELYKVLCNEMDECPCNLFYRQLLGDTVNLSYYGISPLGFRPMAMALRLNKTVKTVILTDNFLSEDGCFHFGDMMADNCTILELNFTGCRMGPEGIKRLVFKIHKNRTIRKLNLSKNELGDNGVEYLAQSIFKGASIADLNLSVNKLSSKSLGFLSEALEFCNTLTHLDLSWNSFMVPKPVEGLVTCLMESDKLVEINMSWNSFGTRFANALSNLLLVPNIRVIDLSNNSLSDDAIQIIADKLPRANKLEVFNMSYNPMSPLDACTLLKYMGRKKIKIRSLLLDGVYVDDMFMTVKNRVLNLKFRKDAVITHGYVLPKVKVQLPDIREIVLNRSEFVCSKPKKKSVDVGLMLLQLAKNAKGGPIPIKELPRYIKELGATQMNNELIEEMGMVFCLGSNKAKVITADTKALADYVHRKWPEAKLLPTPPATPLAPQPAPSGKGKGKDDKGKGKGAKGKK